MAKLKYLVIHCADTPASREVTKGDIEKWHLGPALLPDGSGKVKFRGKVYPAFSALPKEFIDGTPVYRLQGRGWDRLGYSDLIQRSGNLVPLTPYNMDDYVSSDEMTWGAVGINDQSRHICIAGGRDAKGKSITGDWNKIYTADQIQTLTAYILAFILRHQEAIICGHYHWAKKSCPNFSTAEFCKSIGVKSANYLNDKRK